MDGLPEYNAFNIADALSDGYCQNRHGVRIYFAAVKCEWYGAIIYRFDIAPVGKSTDVINWKRSTEWFWTRAEARNTAADIAYKIARHTLTDTGKNISNVI